MKRTPIVLGGALVMLAALIPVRATAIALVGAEAPQLAAVVTGVWLFKLLLAVHGLIAAAAGLPWFAGAPAEAAAPAGESGGPAFPDARAWLLVAPLLVAGAALRLHELGAGLWFDEIQTLVSYVRLPLGQIVATFDSQNQHPLYSVLARASVVALGEGAAALRLPAALFGIASLGALFAFASLITNRREALLATALLAFSYHHVWFSQNARGYSGLLFWTLLGSAALLRLLADPRARGWRWPVGYAAAMALAVYTHATAGLVVAAHFLLWAALVLRARLAGRRDVPVRQPLVAFLLAGTFTLQLYALVLPQFLGTLLEPTMAGVDTAWKDPLWLLRETLRGLAAGVPGGVAAVALALGVALAGVLSYARQSAAVAGVLLLPGVLTAAVLLSLEHNLWPRFFFFSAGFAVLVAVRGTFAVASLAGARARPLATAALVLGIAGSALTVPGAWGAKQDYAGARDFVERSRAGDDVVVTIDMSEYAYQRYLEAGWPGIATGDELERLERGGRRVWVLYTFPTRLAAIQPEIWAHLQREYRTAAEFPGTVGEGTIVVKVRE